MTRPGSGSGSACSSAISDRAWYRDARAAVHAGRADGFDLFLRQLGGGEAAAAFPKALELLIFVRPDEVAGDLAVARHGDGLALGAHPVAAEIAGELGSRDSLGRIHGSLSFPPYVRDSRGLRKSRKLRDPRRFSTNSTFRPRQLSKLALPAAEPEHADEDRQHGQRCADAEVVPEADRSPCAARLLDHDQVGDRAEHGEIAGERGCHGDREPGALAGPAARRRTA